MHQTIVNARMTSEVSTSRVRTTCGQPLHTHLGYLLSHAGFQWGAKTAGDKSTEDLNSNLARLHIPFRTSWSALAFNPFRVVEADARNITSAPPPSSRKDQACVSTHATLTAAAASSFVGLAPVALAVARCGRVVRAARRAAVTRGEGLARFIWWMAATSETNARETWVENSDPGHMNGRGHPNRIGSRGPSYYTDLEAHGLHTAATLLVRVPDEPWSCPNDAGNTSRSSRKSYRLCSRWRRCSRRPRCSSR